MWSDLEKGVWVNLITRDISNMNALGDDRLGGGHVNRVY